MKSLLYLLLFLLLFAFPFSGKVLANANSWRVSFGKNYVFTSSKNKMGDTLTLRLSKIKASDSLMVSRFICGNDARGAFTELVLRNEKNELISKTMHKNVFIDFEAAIPISSIVHAPVLTQKKLFSISVSLYDAHHKEIETLFLGVFIMC
jgi:putative cell wall-binding protein